MFFRKKSKFKSVNFDSTNKLLKEIQFLLRRQSRMDMIKEIFKSDK